ncbi:MAG: sigma 54-interacting transcriptional regulator [Polyangiaceae bacterium]|jgi:two-component system response regulator AtoC|nr:sigma 54-interacting transcriptional regulator [Polyangiaceae bacterium]MBK8942930.1 sigma 54-interacting transcriptional regulator [Polyangiaceae bacterium]
MKIGTRSANPTETFEVRGPQHPSGRCGVLLVSAGDQVGRIVAVVDRGVTIGRAESCELSLDDTGLSRKHAQIQLVSGKYLLRDLDSRNGTFLNERRVDFVSPLEDGDRIRLGPNVRVRFQLVEEGEERVLKSSFEASTQLVRKLTAGPEVPPGRVVADPAQLALYAEAQRASKSTLTILILGETGAGKDVLARAVHLSSPRAKRPYLALNCAALSESLLEAEMFGHEKGAFTGATHTKVGLLEAADGGTVFLDEVGELPPSIQVKLLRVLEERSVLRVGARSPTPIDVRFVAATNRDLDVEVEAGRFRRDLFYRIAQVTLRVPPLRERRSEIAELARWFAERAGGELGREPPRLTQDFLDVLLRHSFPGNVRELRNIVERAVVMSSDSTLTSEHLPTELRRGSGPQAPPASTPRPSEQALSAPSAASGGADLRAHLEDAERARVLEVLERCGNNQTRAAEALGVSRRTLVARLSAWGLTKKRG